MQWLQWIKAHKSEIVVGVVVSLVTALVLKIGDIFMLLMPKAGNTVWTALIDNVYRVAGRFSEITLISMLISFMVVLILSATLSFVFAMFRTIKRARFSEQIEEILEKQEEDSTVELSVDELRVLEQYDEQRKKVPSIKKLKGMLWGLIVYCALFLSLMIYSIVIPAGLHADFERHVTQITPYITDSEVNMLQSQWVSMESKHDYEVIYEYIENVRNVHDLQ